MEVTNKDILEDLVALFVTGNLSEEDLEGLFLVLKDDNDWGKILTSKTLFKIGGREIASFDNLYTFPGEKEATLNLLASEYGVDVSEITIETGLIF